MGDEQSSKRKQGRKEEAIGWVEEAGSRAIEIFNTICHKLHLTEKEIVYEKERERLMIYIELLLEVAVDALQCAVHGTVFTNDFLPMVIRYEERVCYTCLHHMQMSVRFSLRDSQNVSLLRMLSIVLCPFLINS